MLVRMRKEVGADEPTTNPEIDTLILIDRYPFPKLSLLVYSTKLIQRKDVDMVTPCCTQLTYEGLIDEVFQIQNSTSLFSILIIIFHLCV